MTETRDLLFVSLAANQSRFFLALGRQLEASGHAVTHVCFHEGAANELRRSGARVFNPFDYQPAQPDEVNFHDFGVDLPALLIGHEKAAYELRDTAALVRKFKGHLAAMGRIVDAWRGECRNPVMVQELGGFTSVLAAFYAARSRGIDNWFIEPSFFRGRVFFTPNTFSAPRVVPGGAPASPAVRNSIAGVRTTQAVVIPSKDRLHYRSAGRKLADPRNVRRLVEKLVAKHVRGQREEFEHIGGHVGRHVRMFLNSRKLARHYRQLPTDRPLLYYPLHVPADFALTVRSPEYLDQLATIDFLCRCAPLGWRVAIKEHPALIGAIDPVRTAELLRRHDNLVLLSPAINNHWVLSAAEAVVTINSKAGAEALLYRKSVFALGDSFYKDSPLVTRVRSLAELPALLATPRREIDDTGVERFFQDVWDCSHPGELYDVEPGNVAVFAASLMRCADLATGI
ncbi:hypothetical protein [Azospira restricta]|uniref:Capsule biosynthesis protein n=1 Tax=Azospira restricta TaxID=404405 RepID=A0A974SPH8_9RHOO|nr:hypothetical protein [Azospira restricta]QRJ64057.1 capsule biosynthesis protein [Azospira restricta]